MNWRRIAHVPFWNIWVTMAPQIYDGQIFDAYTLMCDLIRSAWNRIIIEGLGQKADSVLRNGDNES